MLGSIGLGVRALIQAGYLVLLSRWMGASGYGMFAGSMAAVMLAAPLSGWGIVYVLSRRVALDPSLARSVWATAIVQVAVIGAGLAAMIVLLAGISMHERISLSSMILLCLSELVVLPVAQAGTGLCFALGRGLPGALAICLVPAGRLGLGLAVAWLGVRGSPDVVVWPHLAGSILGVLATVALVARISGFPAWRSGVPMRETLSEGTGYAAGTLVGQGYQEVDKVLMLQILGASVVGSYTVAFRIVSVFALPVSGLIAAALPRMFAAHGTPDQSGPSPLRAVAVAAAAYGVIATCMAAGTAPWLPHIFGPEFSGSIRLLFELSPWPALFAMHQAAATSLTASGRQRERVFVEGAGLVLIVLMNLLLLHGIGATASVLSLLVGEAVMATTCLILLRRRPMLRAHRPGSGA